MYPNDNNFVIIRNYAYIINSDSFIIKFNIKQSIATTFEMQI